MQTPVSAPILPCKLEIAYTYLKRKTAALRHGSVSLKAYQEACQHVADRLKANGIELSAFWEYVKKEER